MFEETGLERVPGAFGADAAARMRDVVRRQVERQLANRPTVSFKPVKRNRAFEAALAAVPDGFRPSGSGAQVLWTPAGVGPWRMPPGGWHTDLGFASSTWPPAAVKVFSCIDVLEPQGGATLVLEGSHRLVARWSAATGDRHGDSASWGRFLRSDPWLRDLARGGTYDEVVGREGVVDGVPLRVVELTGSPGDAWVVHLHSFHTAAPNALARDRMAVAWTAWGAGYEEPRAVGADQPNRSDSSRTTTTAPAMSTATTVP